MPRKSALPPVDVYMPWFVRDWLTGNATFAMTNEQRGAFGWMLCHAWVASPPCSLPADERQLMKYADMSQPEWERNRSTLLAQWPIVEDRADIAHGRRRNPKQYAVYLEAVRRREEAQRRGRNAANARWGPLGSGAVAAQAPSFAEAIGSFPPLVTWVASSPTREAVLRRLLNRVWQLHGADALAGFAAVVNNALVGMDGPQRTPEEVETAVTDWCDTDKSGSKNALRAFFLRSRRDVPDADGPNLDGPAPRRRGPRAPRSAGAETMQNALDVLGGLGGDA